MITAVGKTFEEINDHRHGRFRNCPCSLQRTTDIERQIFGLQPLPMLLRFAWTYAPCMALTTSGAKNQNAPIFPVRKPRVEGTK